MVFFPPGSNDTCPLAFFKKLFLHFLHFSQDLNRGAKGVAAKVVTCLEKALERSPGRLLSGLGRGARGGEWVATEVVVDQPEALERVPGRLLDRGILGCNLVLLKVGGAVGDDGIC